MAMSGKRWIAAGALVAVAAAVVFAVPTVWGKPWSIDHFFARVFLGFALRHPMMLSQIRVRVPAGPLVILTGQIATGLASEAELVMVGSAYRALLFEKPTRPLAIFNALQVGFAAPAVVS